MINGINQSKGRMKISYAVQRYDLEMKAWKIIYIFNKKKKATELLKDLIKEHPGARYRVGRLLKKLSGKIYK
ncbi:hypothetical protein ES705_17579 [subsurface metagenome]